MMRGRRDDALLTALLTETGSYLLRIHAHEMAAAGTYALNRIPIRSTSS